MTKLQKHQIALNYLQDKAFSELKTKDDLKVRVIKDLNALQDIETYSSTKHTLKVKRIVKLALNKFRRDFKKGYCMEVNVAGLK